MTHDWSLRFGAGVGKQIGIDEIVSLDDLAGNGGEGTREHWAGEGEGVELAALAARIDCGGEVSEEHRVEDAAGEGRAEVARVNTGKTRAKPGGDHLAGKLGGGDAEVGAPDGEDRFESGSGEALDAIGADVFEEEVAKGDAVEAFRGGALADLGHARLVVGVGAGEGKIDLPEREPGSRSLLVEQLFSEAMNGDAAELLVDRGQQGDNFVLGLLAEEVKRPGAIFAAAPAEEDAAWRGSVLLTQSGHPSPPPIYHVKSSK